MVLTVKDVSRMFGGLAALQGVDLTVEEGEILGLIGPNGAGKTTLINCITGVYRPTRGDILFRGESVIHLLPHQISRAGVGRTFQIPRPFLNMTVLQNLQVCAHRGAVNFLDLLHLTGLEEKKDHLAKNLTFQERRRLELSRALAVKPHLLLLDEIAAGLNPHEIFEMVGLIRRIHTEFSVTILWIEHVMKAIMENADRIMVLRQGSKIAEGPPQEIANNPQVIEAYLGEEYQFAET
jgi:branched-chain amino acid transport system ATP-binding protein